MPDPADVRRRAIQTAAQLLAELCGDGAPAEPVRASVSDGEITVEVVVVRCQEVPAGAGRMPGNGSRLTALDRRILAAAPHEEVTMGRLARLADHDPDSYFRERVRHLVAAGKLASEFGGYRLA